MVVADTGVGKSIITLSALAEIGERTIVAAPPKVIAGWPAEAAKWAHTAHLKLTLLTGSPAHRVAALQQPADVLLISLNNLDWLLKQSHGASVIIIDELSKAAGKQTAALKTKKCDCLVKRIGLTATPVSENFEKLYAMMRIIDGGKALGRNKQNYLMTYFFPTDFKQYNWKLKAGSDTEIMALIKPLICDVNTNKADTLPPLEFDEVEFDMPETTRAVYAQMRSDMLLVGATADVVAVNLAVLSGKLRQIASGFAISEDATVVEYDTARAQTLISVLAETDKPALILYEYDHQRRQICDALTQAGKSFEAVYGGAKNKQGIESFKQCATQYLVAQQNTLSHGVDGLQYTCCHIVFYHPLWSNDNTKQAVGRIWRQGTPFPRVTATTLVCADTLDDLVLTRLNTKAENMKLFLKHLREG